MTKMLVLVSCLFVISLSGCLNGSDGGGNDSCQNMCNQYQTCVTGNCLYACSNNTDCVFDDVQANCFNGYCLPADVTEGDTDQVAELVEETDDSEVCVKTPEICDGEDNNCDGQVDEIICPYNVPDKCGDFHTNCYTNGSALPHREVLCVFNSEIRNFECQVGECVEFWFDLDNNYESGCEYHCDSGQVPTAEICDGLDNDCNGLKDDGFFIGTPCRGDGLCILEEGIIECKNHAETVCSVNPGGTAFDPLTHVEICDNFDNDCDKLIDEDFNIGGECSGTHGQCQNFQGHLECATATETKCSVDPDGSDSRSQVETCDGVDNDCDGFVDEDYLVGLECMGKGVCGVGTWECKTTTLGICSTQPGGTEDQSGTEICDGVDNDCDGEEDEGFHIGDACAGVGECLAGSIECLNESETVCSTLFGGTGYLGIEERCNGKDDDCNGSIDEGFGIGDACEGVGECGTGMIECLTALTTTCSTDPDGSASEVQTELCDNLDNNCDGEVDEIFPLGNNCRGIGECGEGSYECGSDGEIQCSTLEGGSEYAPTEELCDGFDNDCDSRVDEDYDIGLVCEGNGQCSNGLWECLTLETAVCSTNPGGSLFDETVLESCDGLDNDCDNEIDEGFELGTSCAGVGLCSDGVLECDPTNVELTICSSSVRGTQYDGIPELCDGMDNDCDGDVDESFSLGNECHGIGECGLGEFECSADGSRTICSTIVGGSHYEPAIDVCDGLDNDCDGSIDEDYQIGADCNGIGECGLGKWECYDLDHRVCSSSFPGSDHQGKTEICDGLDNSCNGFIDDGFGVGEACVGVGACGSGVIECASASETICSTDVGGSNDQSELDVCDGIDNDCNGTVDDGFNIGVDCNGEGACGWGRYECSVTDSMRKACSTEPGQSGDESKVEICDNRIDDDCDGVTDEDECLCEPGDIRECGVSWKGICTKVDQVCQTDRTWSACTAVMPREEICNGLDDNCDDILIGEDDSDDDGSLDCADCEPDNEDVYPDAVELCDGMDNDCDDEIDEDFPLGVTCRGIGACGEGTLECREDGLEVVCSTNPGNSEDASGPELCTNMIDDNCDGEVNEICDCTYGVTPPISCGQSGEGICRMGSQACMADGGFDECTATMPADNEYCNEIDDNCNGIIDEGCECTDGLQQFCGSSEGECRQGVQTCALGQWGECVGEVVATIEMCDGKDNDCDFGTDEDYQVGKPCVGIGECGVGEIECASNESARCDTDVGGSHDQSSVELCDGLDNDCDGTVDEGFPLGIECRGMGACGLGVYECNFAQTGVVCSTAPGGSNDQSLVDACDGIYQFVDDDCDGVVDEDCTCVANIEKNDCGHNTLGLCKIVQLTCLGNGTWGECPAVMPQTEICDGEDNDCDGITDEDFDFLNDINNCGSCGNVCALDNAVSDCVSGECVVIACDYPYHNADGDDSTGCEYACVNTPAGNLVNEYCDNVDNDCDGSVDEDYVDLDGLYNVNIAHCGACGNNCNLLYNVDDVECTVDGLCQVNSCDANYYDLDADPANGCEYNCNSTMGGTEVCDGVDNNCDGQIDEDAGCAFAYITCEVMCPNQGQSVYLNWDGDPSINWTSEPAQGGFVTMTVYDLCLRGEYPNLAGYTWGDFNCYDSENDVWGGWSVNSVISCVNDRGVDVSFLFVPGFVDPVGEGEILFPYAMCE
jgi:Notch 1